MKNQLLIIYLFLFSFTTYGLDPRVFAQLHDLRKELLLAKLSDKNYESLERRFANGNFDEIIFIDDSKIRGPRLTRGNHQKMLDAVNNFFLRNKKGYDVNSYLREKPMVEPFKINLSESNNVEYFKDAMPEAKNEFSIWLSAEVTDFEKDKFLKKMTPDEILRVKKLLALEGDLKDHISASHLMRDKKLFEKVLEVFAKVGMATKSENLSKVISNLMVGYWNVDLGASNAKNGLKKLTPYESMLLKSDFKAYTDSIVKKFKLPSKLQTNFFRFTDFEDKTKQNYFKKGYTVYPMSRWEGLFKGIGVGECIRSSCNRFFDALYPSAFQLGVLRDGKEVGYIGIYKVQKTGDVDRNYWYIDTFQGADLTNQKNGSNVLNEIVTEVQKLAIKDKSSLVYAANDFNGFNFPANAAEIIKRGSIGDEVDISFVKSEVFDDINEFVSKEGQEHHHEIMKNSGYKNNEQMYSTLGRNDYKVRVIPPDPSLSTKEIREMAINIGIYESGLDNTIEPEHLKRIKYLSLFNSSRAGITKQIVETYENNALYYKNSDLATKEYYKLAFPTLFKKIKDFNPDEIINITKFFKKNKNLIGSDLNALNELIYLAKTPKEILDIAHKFLSKDQVSSIFINKELIPQLKKLGLTEWDSFYNDYSKYMNDRYHGLVMAKFILGQTKTREEFLRFVDPNNSKSKKKKGIFEFFKKKVKEITMSREEAITESDRSSLMVGDWKKYIDKNEGPEGLKKYAGEIYSFLDSKGKAQVLGEVVSKAIRPSEIVEILNEFEIDSDSYSRVMFSKFLNKLEVLSKKEAGLVGSGEDWINLYKGLLKYMPSDVEDKQLAKLIIKHLDKNSDILQFIEISEGEISGIGLIKDEATRKGIMLDIFSKISIDEKSTSALDVKLLGYKKSVLSSQMMEDRINSMTKSEELFKFLDEYSKEEYDERSSKLLLLKIEKISKEITLNEGNQNGKWIDVYKKLLVAMPTDKLDEKLGRIVSSNINTIEDFFEFVLVSGGKKSGFGVISDSEVKYGIVFDTWKRLLDSGLFKDRMDEVSEFVLNNLHSKLDVEVRKVLFSKAKSLNEIEEIMSLSKAPSSSFSDYYGALIAEGINNVSTSGVTGIKSDTILSQYERLILLMPNDDADIALAKFIASKIKNRDEFIKFVTITTGNHKGRGLISNVELREKLILEKWTEYVQAESVSELELTNFKNKIKPFLSDDSVEAILKIDKSTLLELGKAKIEMSPNLTESKVNIPNNVVCLKRALDSLTK